MNDNAKSPLSADAPAPNEALHQAQDLHRRRSFNAAERLYRSVLDVAPEQPDALHWLGVLLCGTGRQDQGRALIERSIALVPSFPGFHNTTATPCWRAAPAPTRSGPTGVAWTWTQAAGGLVQPGHLFAPGRPARGGGARL